MNIFSSFLAKIKTGYDNAPPAIQKSAKTTPLTVAMLLFFAWINGGMHALLGILCVLAVIVVLVLVAGLIISKVEKAGGQKMGEWIGVAIIFGFIILFFWFFGHSWNKGK